MSNSVLTEPVEIHPLLAERWSPRAFHQTHEISEASLASLLEAARWAPSANNNQPWRYLVTKRGSGEFAQIVETLSGNNKLWAQHASALIIAFAVGAAANPYAAYDLGQSVTHLAVQAHAIGYHAHQMGGFDRDALREQFKFADDLSPLVIIAVGEVAPADQLPEHLKAREVQPRTRLALDEIVLNSPRQG